MYLTLLWTAAIVFALYLHFRQVYTYFSRHGVKHFTPIPVLGNLTKTILRMEHLGEAIERDYKSFPEERFVGRYALTIRQLVIRDLELIKKITVNDFDHFCDRFINIDSAYEPLLGKSMLFLKAGYIDVEVKDMTTRFANDVIVSFTFGLKVDSYTEVNNDIYATFKKRASIKISSFLIALGIVMVPKLMKVIKLFSEYRNYSFTNFYRHLVKSMMQYREERDIIKTDVIHLIMEAKKRRLTHEDKTTKDVDAGFATVKESNVGKTVIKREWSDDDLTAQAITFVIANLETVSATMSFLLYELAVNPDVQEKLYQEILENEIKNEGNFDYNCILELTYMDMVVSEILRLWPPATILSRICNKDYNCGKPNDKAKEDFILRKGDGIAISVLGIHHDPKYFPDPLKFDPERFSNENKHKINPFSYMPFGLGPRICIGSRLAICNLKVMTYQLLKEMKLCPAAKTSIPAKLDTNALVLQLKGCLVRMTPRN